MIKKFQGGIKKVRTWFSRENLSALRYLFSTLSKIEKIFLLFLTLVILISGSFNWWHWWVNNTNTAAAFGGTYTEGIIGESKDLDKHASRLIGAGLTRLEENGNIVGDIAEKWEIVDDGKTYKFHLREGFNSRDLASQIQAKNIWANIEINTDDPAYLIFKFKQPFSPFLYSTTEPVFGCGPYKILKEEKNRLTLVARDDYWRGKPHLEKIVIISYANQGALERAVERREVMGYLLPARMEAFKPADRYSYHEISLPRELILFFNVTRPVLQNVERRRSLKEAKPLAERLELTLITSDSERNVKVAEALKNKWQELNVNLHIKKIDNISLKRDAIPKRDYDILLYGLDYGPDPDPYPFWHSSQIKPEGMNLSNFSYKKADKLLEEARQTFDFKAREDKYNEFKKILDQEVPFISLERDTLNYAISDKVKGVSKIYGVTEADRFLNADDWYLKTKRINK